MYLFFTYFLKYTSKIWNSISFNEGSFFHVATAIFSNINGRRREYLDYEFDFMEFISIEKYLKLLSGFEAFKFYYFNELNKFNFECISDLFIFSENYDFEVKETKFILSEETIPLEPNQIKFFDEFSEHIKKYWKKDLTNNLTLLVSFSILSIVNIML